MLAEPEPSVSQEELFPALFIKLINEEISTEEIEALVPGDDFYDFILAEDWLAYANYPVVPLPEPVRYRTSSSDYRSFNNLLRYQVSADEGYNLALYAVDVDQNVSGEVALNSELRRAYSQVKDISRAEWVGRGIQVDDNPPLEFTIMMKGSRATLAQIEHLYYLEGATEKESTTILSTPNMLASATVVTENNKIDIYKWRVDYDADGQIDFLISHDGSDKKQAQQIVDFVLEHDLLITEEREMLQTNYDSIVDALTAS